MTASEPIVAWQPVLTDHQAYTLQQLQRLSGAPVIAYVRRVEDEQRRSQGWTETRVTSIERRLIPARGALLHCLRELRRHRGSVHLFCSPFGDVTLTLTLFVAARLGLEFYLVSEPYSQVGHGYLSDSNPLLVGLKAFLRPLVYRGYVALLGGRSAGIFAISRLAVSQYRAAGVPQDRLFPFGYFVPRVRPDGPREADPDEPSSTKGDLRLAYVGNLIRIKGVDVLVEAVRRAQDAGHRICLDVHGPGHPGTYRWNGDRLRYRGAIPFGTSQHVMARYDLVVVPSRYDGWAVVVNEALCAGVPVVCSDAVGARVLVESFAAGVSFRAGDVDDLMEKLISIDRDRGRLAAMRIGASRAAAAIQPDVGASYMLDVLHASAELKAAVPSPWYVSRP